MIVNKSNKGFTLAEMLVVVAMIVALVTLIMPTMTKTIEKAREAVELANIRSAVSMVNAAIYDDSYAENINFNGSVKNMEYSVGKVTKYKEYLFSNVKIIQKKEKWESKYGAPTINDTKLYFESSTGRPYDKETYWVIQYNTSNSKWSIYHTYH